MSRRGVAIICAQGFVVYTFLWAVLVIVISPGLPVGEAMLRRWHGFLTLPWSGRLILLGVYLTTLAICTAVVAFVRNGIELFVALYQDHRRRRAQARRRMGGVRRR